MIKARSEAYKKEIITSAEALAFENYIKVYQKGQNLYLYCKYLEILERWLPNKRLYLIHVPGTKKETMILNMEAPFRSDDITRMDLDEQKEGAKKDE